jgi:hypothetical protein
MEFINGARLWWRRWSTWLAAAFAAVVATVTASPSLFLGLLAIFPGNWRYALAGALFVLCLGLPVLTVSLKQKKLEETRNGEGA